MSLKKNKKTSALDTDEKFIKTDQYDNDTPVICFIFVVN